jgi:hypothetical protein
MAVITSARIPVINRRTARATGLAKAPSWVMRCNDVSDGYRLMLPILARRRRWVKDVVEGVGAVCLSTTWEDQQSDEDKVGDRAIKEEGADRD